MVSAACSRCSVQPVRLGTLAMGLAGHWCSRRCCPPDLPSMPRWTRRRIEQALKEGTVNGVASTNALELGIDIGGLDAAILASYPGTMMSTWQQAGRAGRGSATALVAFEGPLDQYLARHPKELLSKPHEHAVVDLDNPYILNGHVLCAAAELPISDRDEACFGPKLPDALAHWERNGRLAKTAVGWVYHGRGRPVAEVSLDAIDAGRVEVRCNDANGDPSHSSRGRLLEVLSERRAYASAHPGAILYHQGDSYRILRLDLASGVAAAQRVKTMDYTEPINQPSIAVAAEGRRRPLNGGIGGGVGSTLFVGGVEVTDEFVGYRRKRYDRVVRDLQADPRRAAASERLFLQPARYSISGCGLFDHGTAGGVAVSCRPGGWRAWPRSWSGGGGPSGQPTSPRTDIANRGVDHLRRDESEQRGHWCHERRVGSSHPTAAARRSPSRSGAAPPSGCAATPSSTSPAATPGLRSASTGSSVTSTPTPNRRRPLPAGRPRTGRRRVRSTWSGCATPRRTCVACATSATRSVGGLRSTPTAMSATSCRCSRRASFSARPRRPSRSLLRPTFVERWRCSRCVGGTRATSRSAQMPACYGHHGCWGDSRRRCCRSLAAAVASAGSTPSAAATAWTGCQAPAWRLVRAASPAASPGGG